MYPGPAETGEPWSQWGQGAVTADGAFLSTVGDHRGVDGNSYVYEFDPTSGRLTLVSDVLSLVDHQPGAWGYGKIHAQMVPGPCDQVYVSTYWGTRTDLVYGDGYDGDLLLRIDPTARTSSACSAYPSPPTARHRWAAHPRSACSTARPPTRSPSPTPGSSSPATSPPVKRDPRPVRPDHAGFRALAVDAAGRALFTKPEGRVTRYDPATGESTTLVDPLSGRFIRAVTPPAPDGTIYGVTQDPPAWFTLSRRRLDRRPRGRLRLHRVTGDGARQLAVYFVPSAHGDGWTNGTPLMAFDPVTGAESVVVELNPLTEEALGLTAGGTYDVVLDAARRRLFVGLNAAPVDQREDTTFGQVVLAEVTLPVGASAPPPEPTTLDAEAVTCTEFATPAGSTGDGPVVGGTATATSGLEGSADRHDGPRARRRATSTATARGPRRRHVRRSPTRANTPSGGPRARARTACSMAGAGAATFTDAGTPFRPGRTSGAVFADLDLDDDVDLVLARNVVPQSPTPTEIWRNEGGQLRRVPPGRAGFDQESPGRSIGVLDVDGDDLPDVLVLEDRFRGGSSRLYRNLGNLGFQEMPEEAWPAGVHGLGIGTADLDGDGLVDVVVGGSNRVFAGTGAGLHGEVVGAIGPWETYGDEDDAAGVAIGDVDGDGDPDVVIGQHFNSTVDGDEAVPVRLYRNDSTEGSIVLQDVTGEVDLVGVPTKAPHVRARRPRQRRTARPAHEQLGRRRRRAGGVHEPQRRRRRRLRPAGRDGRRPVLGDGAHRRRRRGQLPRRRPGRVVPGVAVAVAAQPHSCRPRQSRSAWTPRWAADRARSSPRSSPAGPAIPTPSSGGARSAQPRATAVASSRLPTSASTRAPPSTSSSRRPAAPPRSR